ncbi:MAG TPA: hypothetical protein VJ617_13180 [Arthrobacter sp.]|nr:hypothetical protein [Arthrobacter sp.]
MHNPPSFADIFRGNPDGQLAAPFGLDEDTVRRLMAPWTTSNWPYMTNH